jgi:hypothetical protein
MLKNFSRKTVSSQPRNTVVNPKQKNTKNMHSKFGFDLLARSRQSRTRPIIAFETKSHR